MPDMTEQLDRVNVAVVYTGVVVITGDKLGVELREILPEGKGLGEGRYYDQKVKKALAGSPGSTYTVDMSSDRRTIFFGSLQYVGRYEDPAQCALWQAESRTIEARYRAKKALKEDSKTSELFDSLALARRAYGRAVGANRAHVLAMIVESIVNG